MTELMRWDDNGTLVTQTDPTQRLRDWVELFREVVKAAEFLSKTPFVPKEMLGKPADVAAAIMKGHELGMDPLDALANIYVIHGRVGFYAEFQRRRIIQAGHTFRVVESSDTRCIVEGIRKEDGQPQRASFSADQARKAGLQLGNYPADKLIARATSRLCRQVFPDVLSGTLIAEDIIDGLIPAGDEPPITPIDEAPPPRPGLQRRRQPPKPKAAATQPPAATPAPPQDDDELLDETPPPEEHGVTETLDENAATYNKKLADTFGVEIPPGVPGGPTEIQDFSEPQVEPPDLFAEPQPEPERITGPQLKKLSILLREQFGDDTDTKHAWTSAAIGRDINSAKDLYKHEAIHAIDLLENPAG